MIEVCGVKFRTFTAKINGAETSFNPPKIKTLRELINAAESGNFNDIINAVCIILNTNADGRRFDIKFVENNFDIEDLYNFLNSYLTWVAEVKNSPNFVSPA